MLVKTDSAAAEYAVRISSTSVLQNLQGYAILRYPVSAFASPPPSLLVALHCTNQNLMIFGFFSPIRARGSPSMASP